MKKQKSLSTRLTAKIHIGAKELGIPRDDGNDADGTLSTYHKLLFNLTGKASTADMTNKEKQAVLDYMRASGFRGITKKPVADYPGKPHNLDRKPRLWKIEAQLADMGLPWSYAETIAKNITGGKGRSQGGSGGQENPGVDRLAWVTRTDHLDGVIAALHVEQEKRSLLAGIDEMLMHLGKTREDLGRQRENWHRHRPTLRAILAQLKSEYDDQEASARAI